MTDLHPGTDGTTHSPEARAAMSQAKQPKTAAIAGPYGHPFHPMLVTVPIGAWIGSVVLDIASRLRSDAALATGADWLLGIGIVALLYLVVEELLVEAHEVPETPWSIAAFFIGFLAFLILEMALEN